VNSSPVAGSSVALDGSASTAATGRTIASYLWQITAGANLASFASVTNTSTATLNTTAAGNVTVQLTVTDNAGGVSRSTVTLAVQPTPGSPAPASGGGGAVSALWLALLSLAAAGLAKGGRRRPD
jgi:serine protease